MALDKEEWFLVGVALIGVLLSAYAVPLHYSGDGSKLCDINETFNCDTVNKSQWSTLFGIPVAILGLLSYTGIALLILKRKFVQSVTGLVEKDVWQYLAIVTTLMLFFQGYLTLAEALWIKAFCIVCIGSQICILLLAIFAWKRFFKACENA